MRNTASPIREFTRDLLLRAGALVAISGSGLDVITEAALSERLGLKEFQPLAFAPDADAPADALLVDYDSPVFDKFGSLVDALGRVTFVDGPSVVLKSIEPRGVIRSILTTHRPRSRRAVHWGCLGRWLKQPRSPHSLRLWRRFSTA